METRTTRKPSLKLVTDHRFVKVMHHKTTGQKALHAGIPFHPGDVICAFGAGSTSRTPTYLTVQTGVHTHITLIPEFLQYINHSCAPNVFFDTTSMELICLQPLQPGDELTFFYPSTEWDMAQPFNCHCGNPECLQIINGASHIPVEVLEKYKLTDFIMETLRRHVPA
jgi:hypothetical protein